MIYAQVHFMVELLFKNIFILECCQKTWPYFLQNKANMPTGSIYYTETT